MAIASVTALLTLEEANTWLSLESDGGDQDALVTAAIAAASTAVANYLGYDPNSRAYTQTLDGNGRAHLYVAGHNITAVSAVSIDGTVIPASTGVNAWGFLTDGDRIVLRGYLFTKGTQNVVVSYTAGHSPVPDQIKQASRYALKAVYNAQDVDPNVASESVPGVYSVSYAQAGNGGQSGPSAGSLPLNAKLFLDPFRRVVA